MKKAFFVVGRDIQFFRNIKVVEEEKFVGEDIDQDGGNHNNSTKENVVVDFSWGSEVIIIDLD